jgi:hypothetical protein
MDMFAIHPYLIPSRLPPTFAHPLTTTIESPTIRNSSRCSRRIPWDGATRRDAADRLRRVGYQSKIPQPLRFVYNHLGTKAAADAIPEALQAKYYAQAFALAACQPTVAGMLIFHVVDEHARAWQSGLYYGNGRPKTSLPAVLCRGARCADGDACAMREGKTTSNVDDVASEARRWTTRPCSSPGSRVFARSYELRILTRRRESPRERQRKGGRAGDGEDPGRRAAARPVRGRTASLQMRQA